MKKVVLSAISDLVTDQRVHKIAITFFNHGYEVLVIGRKLPTSPQIQRIYATKRLKLLFNKGPLFYAEYNLRLFFCLLFSKADLLWANDIDTAPANLTVSFFLKKPYILDNHEYFTGVPELLHRPFVRKIWKIIEWFAFKNTPYISTVNNSLKKIFEDEYCKNIVVLRNVPICKNRTDVVTDFSLSMEGKMKIILYQGALNKDRGLEEAILAMKYVHNTLLVIAGDGDITEQLKKLTSENFLDTRIHFTGRIPFEQLASLTSKAYLGLCIEKKTNLNYQYCLPNKLFDYIHARVPVLAAELPEVKNIILQYNIGTFIPSHDPQHIANTINHILEDEQGYELWKKNLQQAAQELCWEKEEHKLLTLAEAALNDKNIT
ncbi:MAG: glycosyltransferase [Cytophagaceae bacterium]|nr:glycosyltransferase [Cytophagaceae bacterium]MDW8456928.1 glycosyltransferase [Cytophagaceae bacterium]